ncbi:MAG: hypothetical protein ABI575_00705 [Oxalobacteraceae bacterium]
MKKFQTFENALLNNTGLNRQAVFNIDDLPAEMAAAVRAGCTSGLACRQLILIGHAGRQFWTALKAAGVDSADPIDDFSKQSVQRWFADCQTHNSYEIIYPEVHMIGLQQLGQLAGWHHATPFMVGIDQEWGSWFAYRALVVADTEFEPTEPIDSAPPCSRCDHKICINSCPAAALDAGQLDLGKCVAYRKQAGSSCKATCLARLSCPVGSMHRYDEEQIRHSYSHSMRYIERHC